jgi:hypothetical protein
MTHAQKKTGGVETPPGISHEKIYKGIKQSHLHQLRLLPAIGIRRIRNHGHPLEQILQIGLAYRQITLG